MKLLYKSLQYVLLFSILILTGCQSSSVEKLFALPDRETQLVLAQTDEATTASDPWDVQRIQEFSLEADGGQTTYSHFIGDDLRTIEATSTRNDTLLYRVGQLTPEDTNPLPLYEVTLPPYAICTFSPDGTAVVYEVWDDSSHLLLIWHDMITDEERVIWMSDDLSVLFEYSMDIHVKVCFSADGEYVLFMPFLLSSANDSELAYIDAQALLEDAANEYSSIYELMQYNISFARTYNTTTEELRNYFILPQFHSIYPYGSTGPFMAISDEYFVVLHVSEYADRFCTIIPHTGDTPWTVSLDKYLPELSGWYTPLESVFFDNLLYISLNGMGIATLDLTTGETIAFYNFIDPIYSFTVYDNTLIVAQPSATGGTDITAYLLGEKEQTQSILLYHHEASDPYLYHLEVTSSTDGSRMMLVEQHVYIDKGPSKKLILLHF